MLPLENHVRGENRNLLDSLLSRQGNRKDIIGGQSLLTQALSNGSGETVMVHW